MRVGVLISGRGSNLRALIEACDKPDLPAQIVQVISNRADASGLQFAKDAGVGTAVIEDRAEPRLLLRTETVNKTIESSPGGFEASLNEVLYRAKVDIVCLAGFMHVLSPEFVERWRDRLLNIHPSLLPAFRGLNPHSRAIAAGVRWSGCTVHFVRNAIDRGPIITQAVAPVYPWDTSDTLSERILTLEHQCYPQALRLIAQGHVQVLEEQVQVMDLALPPILGYPQSLWGFD